jgi:GNAT superfamily N-acetyltransferase
MDNWAKVALQAEIAYSRVLGSVPTTYPDFIHMHNPAVPWGGDFNCALGARISDQRSFDRIVAQVEQIHREKTLERPDRYDVSPPPLDSAAWNQGLSDRGYRVHTSLWLCARTLDENLTGEIYLYSPHEDEYIEWYHSRQQRQTWYDEADWQRLRPLQLSFSRVFRPYWLLWRGERIGWAYCGDVEGYGYLHDVWIEPSHRRQGFGRMLMQAIRIQGQARGLEVLLVRTNEDRREFYERCEFCECLQSSTIRAR